MCPVGLDIGYSSIKMIQLVVNGGYRSVIAAAKTDIDPTLNNDEQARRNFVISAVKRMLADGDFRSRNVVSCLSNDSLRIASLRLSQTDSVKIEQAVRKEMQPRFGLDPDKDIIHHIVAGDVRHGDEVRSELILLAVDSETVKNHINMLTEIGLRPVAIDAVPCALFRSFERLLQRQEDKEQTAVFVDVGGRFTTVVFGRVGEISFMKHIPIAGERFDQEVAAKLGVDISGARMLRRKVRAERSLAAKADGGGRMQQSQEGAQDSFGVDLEDNRLFDGVGQQLDASARQAVIDAVGAAAEELAKELSLCFRYYTVTFMGRRVGRAVFAGGGAYEDILLDVLKRHLAVKIELAQPLKGFDLMNVNFGSDRRGLLCDWAVAVGLSLKGLASNKSQKTERRRLSVPT
jgi:type IV pilus assembly protein PilM